MLAVALLSTVPSFVPGNTDIFTAEMIRQLTHTVVMGQQLYSTYLLPFEIAGLILLVALLGGMVLARREGGRADDSTNPSLESAACGEMQS